MAAAQPREPDRDAALRRVAIVLSSLPAPVASRLLGTVDAEAKRQLRSTMSTLVDVDPMERRLALQAFKGSVEQHQRAPAQTTRPSSPQAATRAGDIEDEIIISRGDRPVSRKEPMSRVVPQAEMPTGHSRQDSRSSAKSFSEAPLAFLNEVDDKTLMNLLQGEHPQTIALVLASIAPTQAALILPKLESRLQSEALSRIGRLGEIPEDAVINIADHLRERIRQQTKRADDSSGNRALHAILAAMPNAPSPPAATQHRGEAVAAAPRVPVESAGYAATAVPAINHLHRAVGGSAAWSKQTPNSNHPADSLSLHSERPEREELPGDDSVSDPAAEPTTPASTIFDSTDAIHQHLIELSPSALCQALGKVQTRVALLTLCGLPSEVAESVLTILPRSHSKEVRRQLRSLGSLELREIDQAKEEVARASTRAQTALNTTPEAVVTRVPLAA